MWLPRHSNVTDDEKRLACQGSCSIIVDQSQYLASDYLSIVKSALESAVSKMFVPSPQNLNEDSSERFPSMKKLRALCIWKMFSVSQKPSDDAGERLLSKQL